MLTVSICYLIMTSTQKAEYSHFKIITGSTFNQAQITVSFNRVATNLENKEKLENSGNLKNCQNLRENSGKFEFLLRKPGKLRENETM